VRRFLNRVRALFDVPGGVRERRPPDAFDQAVRNRRVHRMQRQPCCREPLAKLRRCRWIVVIEMRPRREQLHRVEPCLGDRPHVLESKRRVMKQMR
jgi:hypothetical protein